MPHPSLVLLALVGSAQSVRRLLALSLLLLLAMPCTGQMIWSRHDPDMTSTAPTVSGSYGPAYDASRGRHLLFLSEVPSSGPSGERIFGFDGEDWTSTSVAGSFGDGTMITTDPTGPGRILQLGSYASPVTARWDPNAHSITSLPSGPVARGFGVLQYAPGIGAVRFGGVSSPLNSDDRTWTWDGVAWHDVTALVRPPARWYASASRGGAGQALVMFGGDSAGGLRNDTWTFDGTNWTQRFPATVPPVRNRHAMAYDVDRNRVVMYGGLPTFGSPLADTWEWDGTNWRAMGPAHSPPTGTPISMNWDPLRHRVVLVGINTDGLPANLPRLPIDTWEWNGTDWTQLNSNPTGAQYVVPSARAYHILTYDRQRRRTVEFGGFTDLLLRTRLNDTWESENGVWQPRSPTGSLPPLGSPNAGTTLRPDGTLCFVPGRGVLISNNYNELWRWNGVSWSVSALSAPPIIPLHQVLGSFQTPGWGWVLVRLVTTPQWTSQLQVIVPSTGQVLPQYVTSGGPSPRVGSSMIQAASTTTMPSSVWVFGGSDGNTSLADAWELFDPGFGGFLGWNQLIPTGGPVPAGRRDAATAHVEGPSRLIVFGGLSSAGQPLGDTWSFDLTTRQWTQLGAGPSPRYGAAMTFDASINKLVLTGGYDGTTVFDEVWEHDGVSWSRRTPPGTPSPRHNHSFVYDRANHRAVLFGGHDGQTALNDTWSYDGSQWTPIVGGVASPSPRFTHAACYVDQGASMVMFGGTTDGSFELGDTWRLDQAGQWTQGASGPPSRVNPSMVYAIVQGQPSCLLFGGYAQGSRLGDTWRYLPASDTWQPLAGGPPARDIHAMAWDRMRNVVVMFGGRSVNAFFADDTWEFNCANATWSLRSPAHRPPPRWNCTMDFDQSRGRTVMFGGYNGSYLNDVWEWDGSDWQQRQPETDAPEAREDAIMAYDSDRGRMAMFGGSNGSSAKNDLWYLSARVDRAGAGNTVSPTELRFYSQPALGQTLQLGFANPQGIGVYFFDLGPLLQPRGTLSGPPVCEASNLWASAVSSMVSGRSEPNIGLAVPNSPTLRGLTLVFQAFAVQPAGCFRATDALQVRL